MVILPTPPPPAPHVSGLLPELKSGVRSRNCIFISLTSGSIFGFSSPAAAVARLMSEQLNLGQPLTSLALVAEPCSRGEVSVTDGFFFFGGGGLGREGANTLAACSSACAGWHFPFSRHRAP